MHFHVEGLSELFLFNVAQSRKHWKTKLLENTGGVGGDQPLPLESEPSLPNAGPVLLSTIKNHIIRVFFRLESF